MPLKYHFDETETWEHRHSRILYTVFSQGIPACLPQEGIDSEPVRTLTLAHTCVICLADVEPESLGETCS